MGVPITFLDKYSPEQFEMLGVDRYVSDKSRGRYSFIKEKGGFVTTISHSSSRAKHSGERKSPLPSRGVLTKSKSTVVFRYQIWYDYPVSFHMGRCRYGGQQQPTYVQSKKDRRILYPALHNRGRAAALSHIHDFIRLAQNRIIESPR